MGFGSVNVFERGQVWMVAEPEDVTQAKINSGDRTICYTRPCVVLTPSDQIMGGPLITVVPITSKIGVVKEHDIVFRNHDHEQNKIMVNQLTTRDSDMFIRYMFTMPDDIMRAIEEQVALITGLSLSTESSELDSQKISELEKELARAKECIKLLRKELVKTKTEADSAVSDLTAKKSSRTRTPKKKWSEEQAIDFLKDGSHMTTEELMKKYGLASKGSVHSTRYLLKKKYGECTSC